MSVVACISSLLLCCTAAALQTSPLSAFSRSDAPRVGGRRRWVRESPEVLSRFRRASFHRTMCATSEDSLAAVVVTKNVVALAPSPGDNVLFASTTRKLLKKYGSMAAVALVAVCAFLSNSIKMSLWKMLRATVGFGVAFALTVGYIGLAALMGVLLGLGAANTAAFFKWLSGGLSNKQTIKDAIQEVKDLKDFLSRAIANSKVVLSKEKIDAFVHRPALEQTLVKMFNAPPEGIYNIIYGAKGVGKTAVAQRVAAGREEGVVMLRCMGTINSRGDVVLQLVKKFTNTECPLRNSMNLLIEVIERCEKVPTIIFDIDRGGVLDRVRSVCKNLARYSRCFVILSDEAYAEAEFGRDPAREKFLFVDEMTIDEAKNLLKLKLRPDRALSEETMNRVFETIGTNAANLIMFCSDVNDGHSVDEILELTLQKSKRALSKFPFKRILKEPKEHPDGVRVHNFVGVVENGKYLNNENDVMRAANIHNVILFHERLLRYQLVSTNLLS